MPEPFDHPEWLFELKHDGFRALAVIEGGRCILISRNGNELNRWPQLAGEVAATVRAKQAVLDGEVVCVKADGGSDFYALLSRRDVPCFYAFDALQVEGEDLRQKPLLMRKRWLKAVMPRATPQARLRYVDHVRGRGRALFTAACLADQEGIVAKLASGRYHADGRTTSWLKIKNPAYSQTEGRHELFAGRGSGRRAGKKACRLDPAARRSLLSQ
jgi:bifunctional non-homologous end joining protein LigD